MDGEPVLPVGPSNAAHYSEIRAERKFAGRPLPTNGVWIAALSREHGLPLVSRDPHFQAFTG